jgi:Ca-activated chloride channel homolog
MIDIMTPVRPGARGLEPAAHPSLPLLGVRARGRLDGLLFELEVEQRYRNDGERAIEAVFTFPVPSRAALLGLELELGERRLQAVAVAKAQATERYEKAIDAGDAAVLLEAVGNGLHTVSVGNLKPGESAVIRYRHAELLDANRGLLRLQVPTVIAPRYGNPGDAGLEGPAVPGTDLLAEYPFDIELLLAGIEAGIEGDAALESPTHSIRVHSAEGGTVVRLAQAAVMDRDFVLEVPQAKVPQQALVARDGDEWIVLASAVLPGLPEADVRALALTLVLDCSGSMAGESIGAARRAVGRVLESLEPRDRIGLLRFGSTHRWETEGLVPASRDQLARLRAVVRGIDADLGGTEMRTALEEAVRLPVPAGANARPMPADLLLITDGQVHELERIAARVAQAGRRLFVVAVGSAPNEALARRLSEVTGGACEFIASGELAEDAILRMFRRMRARPRAVSQVDWPGAVEWMLPPPTAVFPDETVHLIAGLRAAPRGVIRIAIGEAGRETLELAVSPSPLPDGVLRTLVRVAAARRVAQLVSRESLVEATALAVRHQLATSLTSFVVVAERADADKVQGLPATVAVPHALPAGFMGANDSIDLLAQRSWMPMISDSVEAYVTRAPSSKRSRSVSLTSKTVAASMPPAPSGAGEGHRLGSLELSGVQASLSGGRDERASAPVTRLDRQAARTLVEALRLRRVAVCTFDDLAATGVDASIVGALRDIARMLAAKEKTLVRAFVDILLEMAEAAAEDRRIVEALAPSGPSVFAGRRTRALRQEIRQAIF